MSSPACELQSIPILVNAVIEVSLDSSSKAPASVGIVSAPRTASCHCLREKPSRHPERTLIQIQTPLPSSRGTAPHDAKAALPCLPGHSGRLDRGGAGTSPGGGKRGESAASTALAVRSSSFRGRPAAFQPSASKFVFAATVKVAGRRGPRPSIRAASAARSGRRTPPPPRPAAPGQPR